MNKKKILITTILLFAFFLFSSTDGAKVMAASEDEAITKGIYIDSIDIGGMTAVQAKQAVDDYVDGLKGKSITVNTGEHTESITLKDLDFNYTANNYIEEALNVGKMGNLVKRYKDLKDIEESNLVYKLQFQLNEKKIAEFVANKCSIYDNPAVNAEVTRKNGEFVYIQETVGSKVDANATINAIKSAVLEGWNQQDMALNSVIVEDIPKYTLDTVKKCNTLLGTYSTTYATSSSDRAGNVSNGARLINNTVLYPGDVFSGYEKLTPFTLDNGYHIAGAYSNGKVIDSIGGGACQVTTTLYNAVLLSELEVVERFSHSMTISYVDLSRDAAIAGTWKDLKFKNNLETPILIEGYTYGRTITFNIWGEETRDIENRKIKYETVVLSEKQPGKDIITKDPTQPTTYELVTQSAHVGYNAELYKIIYENGVQVSRTRVNQSIYNASPREVTKGTKKEIKKPPVAESTDESNTTDVNTSDENSLDENDGTDTNTNKKGADVPSDKKKADANTIDEDTGN